MIGSQISGRITIRWSFAFENPIEHGSRV